LGLVTYGIGALLWLFVLARIDVTLAYPFVGLGFILIMFFGFAILGEQLGTARIAGTLLITTGVVLLANS
jgi:multidrug transporter EmrE-like cation transporter